MYTRAASARVTSSATAARVGARRRPMLVCVSLDSMRFERFMLGLYVCEIFISSVTSHRRVFMYYGAEERKKEKKVNEREKRREKVIDFLYALLFSLGFSVSLSHAISTLLRSDDAFCPYTTTLCIVYFPVDES